MTTDERYLRHSLIDWFDQARISRANIAVIGAGAIGNEVVKNLVLLGAGRIDVFDFDRIERHNLTRGVLFRDADVGASKAEVVARRAAELDPNVIVSAIEGDFWDTLSLGRLASYDCAIACVDNFEARIRLNQLCVLAQVGLVNAGIDSRHAVVEVFPAGTACYECHLPASAYGRIAERYSCGWLKKRAHDEKKIPTTTITASIAGALAASAALRLGDASPTARRVLVDTINGSSSVARLARAEGCIGCARFATPPAIVPARASLAEMLTPAAEIADLAIESSDPIVCDWHCTRCGSRERAAETIGRRAADYDDTLTRCPSCGTASAAVEIRDRFALGELQALIGERALPAKYLLAEPGGRMVCIDLEAAR